MLSLMTHWWGIAVGPFAQPRDAAQQVEEEEHAHPNLLKGDYQ
jgi:hypothetical protein